MILKSCPPDNSKRHSGVLAEVCVEHSVKSLDTPEKLSGISSWWKSDVFNAQGADDDHRFSHTATYRPTGFDLHNRLSVDEPDQFFSEDTIPSQKNEL